jgi:hypothetical protein
MAKVVRFDELGGPEVLHIKTWNIEGPWSTGEAR